MTKFTCTTISCAGRNTTTERTAETAEKAAEQCAKAIHSAYWVSDTSRDGQDSRGSFTEFTIMEGRRAHSAVRVYSNYR